MAEPVPIPPLRSAAVWQVLRAELDRRPGQPLQVIDAGGGSGSVAVPLAELGHRVTVVDTSPDALAALERRAADSEVADRVHAVQGDVDALGEVLPTGSADLVLCHNVLEYVDEPAVTVTALAAMLRAGGALSLVVANLHATLLARVLAGRVAEARRVLDDPSGRWGDADGVLRRFDTERASDLLTEAGLTLESVHGARVLVDLVPAALLEAEPGAVEVLRDLELAVSDRSPYRDLATQLHLLARR